MPNLVLGPVIGGLSHTTVNLWGRADERALLSAWLGRAPDLSDARMVGSSLLVEAAGFSGKVKITGLKPNTTYYYALTLNETPPKPENVPFPSFTTAPPPQQPTDFSFAFGSCFLPGAVNDGATLRHLDQLLPQHNLRFLLMLGDQIYADLWWGNGLSKIALTEEDYRAVYLHTWGHPAWRELMRRLPAYMILDDHEVDDDWAWTSADRYEGRIPWWDALVRKFKGFPAEARRLSHRRIQAALQAYWEHQAMHAPPLLLPPEGVEFDRPLILPGDHSHFAYTFEWGGAAFFVLDTRTQRVYKHRLLNRAQWKALEDWLLQVKDRYPVKFIVSSITVLSDLWGDFTHDRWNGYPDERRRLLHLLAANEVQNLYLLTGDLHSAHAIEVTLQTAGKTPVKVWEFCSSPFEQKPSKLLMALAKSVRVHPITDYRVHFRYSEPNFGVVHVHFSEGRPSVRFEIYGDSGPAKSAVEA